MPSTSTIECKTTQAPTRLDPRSARSRRALRDALASEVESCGDLSRVTVTAVANRSGLTRRTFYSHFHDIPDLVSQTEEEALTQMRQLVEAIAAVHLDDLNECVGAGLPCPGATELLDWFRQNGHYLTAMLGPGGDPAFMVKVKNMAHEAVAVRALDGIDARALGAFFDYYLTFAISAEVGVLLRWLSGGMRESSHVMAQLMTGLMFVRPGDLYGNPIDLNIPAYGLALMDSMMAEEQNGGDQR